MPSVKLTQKQIESWCGAAVYAEAEAKVKRGEVRRADLAPPWIEGLLARAAGDLRCRFKLLDNGLVESHCPCRANREHGLICSHVAALAISVMRRAADPGREQRYQEEQRRARRMADSMAATITRDPHGRPARLLLALPEDWRGQFDAGAVTLRCAFQFDSAGAAAPAAPEALPSRTALRLSPADDNVLCVLEDIAENGLKGTLT
ncbi:MAG: SWIM zinc finger domain-containing protein, partial [Kiritimatiellae bacterium]|nr:SWIM zinc finger domain-containing protein [Kiritimatiellia bacterium]